MSLPRPVVLVAWAVVVGLLLIGLYWAARLLDYPFVARGWQEAERRAAAAGVPLTQTELLPERPVPEDENAAAGLRQALRLLAEAGFPHTDAMKVRWNQLTDEEFTRVAPALAVAIEASRRPRLDWGYDYDEGFALDMTEIGSTRYLAGWLTARALRSSGGGRPMEAVEDLAAARRIGALGVQDPLIIALFVTSTSDTNVYNAAARIAAAHPQDAALRSEIRGELLEPLGPDVLYRAIRGEAYLGIAGVRNVTRLGGLRSIRDGVQQPVRGEIPIRREGAPSRVIDRAYYVRTLDYWAHVLPQFRAIGSIDAIEELRRTPWRPEKPGLSQGLSHAVDEFLVIYDVFLVDPIVVLEARRRVLSAYLDVLDARAKSGAFPDRLPATAAALVDPLSGKPLQYKRTADGFRVWSVDRDRRDDGGMTSREAGEAMQANPSRPRPVDMVYAYPWPYP